MKRDIRWLSGVLEGEGCFGLYPNTRGRSSCARIGVEMTDQDTVAWIARLLGCNVRGPYRHQRGQRTYAAALYGQRALRMMRRLLPYMGKRRSAKIKEVLCLAS